MIIDHIANCRNYPGLGRNLVAALRHLNQNAQRLSGSAFLKPRAEYGLNESDIVLVNNEIPKKVAEAALESHQHHIDIHYMALGNSRVGWALAGDRQPSADYDPASDVQLYHGSFDLFPLNTGMFAVLMPNELHAAGIVAAEAAESASFVRRVIMKVLV